MTNFNEKKPVFISLIRLGIALGIIYYLLTEYFFENIILFVSSSKLGYLVCASILSIIFHMFLSTRLKLLAEFQKIPISIHSVFKIKLIAAFYGLFLPAKNLTGGAIVFYELSKVNNKKAEALASIIIDRVLATIALCLVGALFWSMDRTHAAANFGYSLIFVFGIFLIVIIVLINVRILNSLSKFLAIFNLPSLNRSLSKFHESLLKYRNIPAKSLAFIFILSTFYHFLEVLVYYLLAKSLWLNISVVTIGWIRAATILAMMVPITISGFGVREGILILLLKPYGVSGEEAFAFSILIFLVTNFQIGIIGGLFEVGKMMFKLAKRKRI